MSKYWTDKNGLRWLGGSVESDGRRIFNPTDEQLAAAGYTEHEELPYIPTLADVMALKLAEIAAYDTSEAVNSFVLNGMVMWLPFELREKVRARLPVEQSDGRTMTTLWYGTIPVQLPIDFAGRLMDKIELYAADCYDVTAAHKAAVEALDSIDAVEDYDYKRGYPERLVFSI